MLHLRKTFTCSLNTPLFLNYSAQIVDASVLKQYIFQKGFITEAAKAKREAEAQNATLQVLPAPSQYVLLALLRQKTVR